MTNRLSQPGLKPDTFLPLDKLAGYYDHLAELAKGYERDTAKLEENLKHVYEWRDEVEQLEKIMT